jgi:hypothetical protein
MMSFRDGRLRDFAVPAGTVWLLTDIAEAKGRQGLYTKQAPQVLKALRETALVQSVESSNRIEGVTVAPARLRPLVIGNARPRDRSEEEIQGYRCALNLIHSHAADLSVTPDTLRQLHKTIQEGGGDAGEWKRINNDIVELRAGAAPRVRFRPVSVKDPGRRRGVVFALPARRRPGACPTASGWGVPGVRLPVHPPIPRRQWARVAVTDAFDNLPARH